MGISFVLWLLAVPILLVRSQYCPLPNNFSYHGDIPQTIRSFEGIYHSNFNETITFCNFKPKAFELNAWDIIPVLAQTAYGAPPYTSVGAVLTGSTYTHPNNSIIWRGFGFSATGPYNCAFALSTNGSNASGFYTYVEQKNGSSPAGETGEWLLSFVREPTRDECRLVWRAYGVEEYETGCDSDGGS